MYAQSLFLSLPWRTRVVGGMERVLALLVIATLLLQPFAPLIDSRPQPIPATRPRIEAATLASADLSPSAPSTPKLPTYALPSELVGKAELPMLRTANSATFDMGNGEFALLEDSVPLHYQDSAGEWQPIDAAFSEHALGWINNTNSLRSILDRQSSRARIGADGMGVSWEPAALLLTTKRGERAIASPRADGATAIQSGDGRTVRYADAWSLSGLQDQWQSGPGQVEYTMRLPELPKVHFWQATPDALDLKVNLQLQAGTLFTLNGEAVALPLETQEPLILRGKDGEEMILQPPFTYEQDRPGQRVAGSYLLQEGDKPGEIELRVRTPWSWLAAPERSFPVIIDPMFQMRSATSMLTWAYNLNTMTGQIKANGPYALGRTTDAANRLLLRFAIPRLPSGSNITKGTLLVKPADIVNLSYIKIDGLIGAVKAYPIKDGTGPWRTNNNPNSATPEIVEASAFAPGQQPLGFLRHGSQRGLQWDVTSAVQGWRTPNVDGGMTVNHGVILQTSLETCVPNTPAFVSCGAFLFEQQYTNWPLSELEFTQQGSSNPLDIQKTKTGGVRLIVQYTAASLQENVPVMMNYLGGGNVPPGVDPYYKLNHLYNLPAIPNYWQAVVARSFGPSVGQNPPPAEGQIFQRPLQGGLPLSVRTPAANNSESYIEWRNVTPTAGQVSYALINGRGAANVNPALQVAVGGNTDEPQPVGYEIRLQKELGTIDTNTPAFAQNGQFSQTLSYTFNSYDPLALWNLNLPQGSNTEVRVTVESDTSSTNGYMPFADHFAPSLINSDGKLEFPNVYGDGADEFTRLEKESLQFSIFGKDERPRKFSQMIVPHAGQTALALAYNGPAITLNDVVIPTAAGAGVDAVAGDVGPIGFRLKVQVISCAAGSYPNSAGNCIRIECPTSSFPAANIVTAGGVRLWNAAGWNKAGTSGTSISGATARMMGPLNGPPTVMLLGVVSYNTGTNPHTISVATSDKAILVQCPTPGANTTSPLQAFPVTNGSLIRQTVENKAGFTFSTNSGNTIYNNPWSTDDRQDISQSFHIFPADGKAVGSGLLNRYTGPNAGDARNLRFDTAWSWTANGWPSLAIEKLTPRNDNPLPSPIASVNLSMGTQFEFDVTPANGNSYRQIKALRAKVATLTQPQSMGGASRNVQAVILPRNEYVPTVPAISCFRSCIDLRGPTDSATRLDRVWEMPDVHVSVGANTVLMRSEGVMQVYSTDHPMASGAFTQDYSFDAYKASVSVDKDYCTKEDQDLGSPKVLVIRGETRMALPNIGSTNDPNAAISAGFKLCETSLRNVHMSFKTPVGLPIGSSGLFLTGLDGSIDISPINTRVTLGLDFQAAPGGDGGLFKVRGQVTIDTLGLFEFQGKGAVLGTVNVDGRIWVAWNPLDTGFEISVSVGRWLEGFARAHIWVGRGFGGKYTWLPDNNEKHFAGQIKATLTIPEGIIIDWGPIVIPPDDISFSVEVAFGEFCTNSSCTRYEWGIKGKFTLLGYDVGLYYGFKKGLDFILGNDDHILIDQYGGAAVMSSAAGEIVQVQEGPLAVDGVADIPFTVKASTEQILVAVGWQAGSPQLTLVNPDGAVINPITAGAVEAYTNGSSAIITVQTPKAGAWIARLGNLSEAGIEHYRFLYLANEGAPGTPANRGRILKPSVADESGTNSYTITWEAPADATDAATISLFYSRTEPNSEVITGAIGIEVPIVQNLPFKAGSFNWDTRGLRNGSYQIKAVVDDGFNELPLEQISQPDDVCIPATSGLPFLRAFAADRFPGTVVMTSTGTVRINDTTPPSTPTGLQVAVGLGALVAQWNPLPADSDATQYLLRWGPRNAGNPAIFDVENQTMVTVGAETKLRLGAVKVNVPYGVDISAVDANGNISAQSAPVFATATGQGEPVPFAPPTFELTSVNGTSASFQWSLAFGPVPAGYRLTYTKLGNEPEVKILNVANSPATITDLTIGATYDVALTAFNSEGWQSTVVSPTIRLVATNGVDSNGDGLPDDWAAANGVAGGTVDSDGDGATNAAEFTAGTHPKLQDSDGDGLSDGEELAAGSDPLNSSDYGTSRTQPRLLLLDDRLSFTAKKQTGGEAAPKSVEWFNVGGGTLNLQATPDAAWINANVVSNTVQISVNHANLDPGFHSSVVRLGTAPGSDPLIGSPACIRVNAWVLRADNDIPAPLQKLYLPTVQR